MAALEACVAAQPAVVTVLQQVDQIAVAVVLADPVFAGLILPALVAAATAVFCVAPDVNACAVAKAKDKRLARRYAATPIADFVWRALRLGRTARVRVVVDQFHHIQTDARLLPVASDVALIRVAYDAEDYQCRD